VAENGQTMLEIRDVEAHYGDVQALWGVNLQIGRGEIVALIGANGAGKTTLMRTIAGLHRPSAGGVFLDGTPLHTLPPHKVVERGVVLVPEGRHIFTGMRVLENLEMGAYASAPRRERQNTLRRVYEIFPILAERKNSLAANLSGGQQQMLAIGRALMGLPRLLLLDEPSLGLAPIVVQEIFGIIRDINRQGVTVVLVEQNARAALRLASRAYVMEQGRVAGEGSGSEMMTDEGVRRAYLGDVARHSAESPA
jgi:branched-chain amino acid transport system ATP-binding protein